MKLKKLTSLIAFFIAVGILVSSTAMYIVPKGYIAHQTNWHFLFLDREQWQSLHINLGTFFLLIILIHLVIHGKELTYYIKQNSTALRFISLEFITAFILVLLLILGSLTNIPPFQWITQGREFFKHRAEQYSNHTRSKNSDTETHQQSNRMHKDHSTKQTHPSMISNHPQSKNTHTMKMHQCCTKKSESSLKTLHHQQQHQHRKHHPPE